MSIRYSNGKYHIDGLVAIELNKSRGTLEEHTHDFIELVYVLRGRALQTVDGADYPTAHGDMLMINYHSTHSFTCDGELEYINILIKPEMVSESLSGRENAFALLELDDYEDFRHVVNEHNRLIRFEGTDRKNLEILIRRLYSENKFPSSGSDLMLRSGLNMLLISLFRKMSLPMKKHAGGIDGELLGYIKMHLDEQLTLEKLARRSGYNSCYFSRLFKRKTGVTLTEYLSACRIECACELLEQTDLPVERIIGEVGFSNRTKFFSEFTKRIGVKPLAYRKNNQSADV